MLRSSDKRIFGTVKMVSTLINMLTIVCYCTACQAQQTQEIASDDLNMAIEQDSVLTISQHSGERIEEGAYVVPTQDSKENGRVEFYINKELKADGLVKFYTAENILFKQFSIKNGILNHVCNYDQHNGKLQDSLYFAIAEIPVFEEGIPVWKKLRVQQRRSYMYPTLNTHEILHDENVVLKTTYDQSRKNIEIANSIYVKMYYENEKVASIKSVDWEKKLEKYEQFNQQGVKVIEITQSDLAIDRKPYQENKARRTANAADFYEKTIYYESGQPQEITYYKAGIVTSTQYNLSGKEIKKTSATYDVLPSVDIF